MALLALAAGVLGLLIGSFLNVVIWRVPRGESVAHPPSACPRCGNAIRPRDNIPVLGWLLLRGRCRDCGEPVSIRYPLVELGTALLFAATALRFGLDAVLPAYLFLAAVGLALALIDLDTKKLPDVLTLPSYAVAAALLVPAALVNHEPRALVHAVAGGALMYALYYALWFIGGMGFGDVKFAGVLGAYLGYLGPSVFLVGVFAGFFLGGVVSIALLLLGRAKRKDRVPYGPFMISGALMAVLVGNALGGTYLRLFGL